LQNLLYDLCLLVTVEIINILPWNFTNISTIVLTNSLYTSANGWLLHLSQTHQSIHRSFQFDSFMIFDFL
jgi:hypothetical protein